MVFSRVFLKKMMRARKTVIAVATDVKKRFPSKTERIQQIYDIVKQTSQSGMSLRPCIDQKGRMRTGFGCFVSKDDFLQMGMAESPLRGHQIYPFSGDKGDLYNEIICENRAGRNHTYVFDNGSIRRHTMKTIRAVENEIIRFVPNYRKLPIKAQGLLVQTYIKTDGDLKSYPKMCQAFNQCKFNVSEKDIALKSAINLYDARFSLDKINQARLNVLKTVQNESLHSKRYRKLRHALSKKN